MSGLTAERLTELRSFATDGWDLRASQVLPVLDELDRLRAVVDQVEALMAENIADTVQANVHSARGDVRCLRCDIRYAERQEYSCGDPGSSHHYPTEWLAEAEQRERFEPIEYVQLSIDDLRTALTTPTTGDPS